MVSVSCGSSPLLPEATVFKCESLTVVNVRYPVFWCVTSCAVRYKCIRISEVLIANIFEIAFSSKMLVKCRTTLCHIPEDAVLSAFGSYEL